MISVCMATYNGENYIKKQMLSILNQLSLEDEVIISDNGSTDSTIDILRDIGDPRIKIFFYSSNEKNKFYRITKNFQNAILHAKGDYICLSDQDDLWLPNRLENIKYGLQQKSCMITNYKIIDQNDMTLVEKYYKVSPLNNFLLCVLKFPFLGCTMAFQRIFFYKYCFPFPQKLILHDIWIGLIAYAKKELYFEPSVLHCYRSHDSNMTMASKGVSQNSFVFMVRYRLYIYFHLVSRIFIR